MFPIFVEIVICFTSDTYYVITFYLSERVFSKVEQSSTAWGVHTIRQYGDNTCTHEPRLLGNFTLEWINSLNSKFHVLPTSIPTMII